MTTNKKLSESTGKRPMKLSGHQQVIEFLNELEHPLKKEIEEVRKIILGANVHITENIKWNAPSFCINNEDRVTFNLQGKGFFRLIFHCGAKSKAYEGKGPLLDDTTGLLDWVTDDRAIVKLTNMSEVEAKREMLAEVVARWIEVTS
jgi:uncharacterized protein YdeI (YjbR/CyaY-like superfamily)